MLAAGSRLGTYEVVSPLGAGGMGEVYRANAPRLPRLRLRAPLSRKTLSRAGTLKRESVFS